MATFVIIFGLIFFIASLIIIAATEDYYGVAIYSIVCSIFISLLIVAVGVSLVEQNPLIEICHDKDGVWVHKIEKCVPKDIFIDVG